MKTLEKLYEGKAKQVMATDDPHRIIIHYKDDATAWWSFISGSPNSSFL